MIYPKGTIELRSRISATYYLERNPRTGRQWQLGDRVRAGEVIARFEDKEFINSVRLESNELSLELAESELQKQQALFEIGGVTPRELNNARVSFINAQYSLENARLQMERLRVTAPFDGVIVELPYYTQGIQIENNTSIARVMNYSTMYMDVRIPEKYLSVITPGQEARLTNHNLPNDTIPGEVTQTSPAIDADTRTFKGMITADNDDLLFRPGMFVKADIVITRKDSVIVIPKDMILTRQRGRTVFVVDRGMAMERVIRTGLETATHAEVVSGLNIDERLVTSGYETLSNRARVRIVR